MGSANTGTSPSTSQGVRAGVLDGSLLELLLPGDRLWRPTGRGRQRDVELPRDGGDPESCSVRPTSGMEYLGEPLAQRPDVLNRAVHGRTEGAGAKHLGRPRLHVRGILDADTALGPFDVQVDPGPGNETFRSRLGDGVLGIGLPCLNGQSVRGLLPSDVQEPRGRGSDPPGTVADPANSRRCGTVGCAGGSPSTDIGPFSPGLGRHCRPGTPLRPTRPHSSPAAVRPSGPNSSVG